MDQITINDISEVKIPLGTEQNKKRTTEKILDMANGLAYMRKSGELISSVNDATLTEQKLCLIGLYLSEIDEDGKRRAKFSARGVKKYFPRSNGGSFYQNLKLNVRHMMGRYIVGFEKENPVTHKKSFEFISLITNAVYDDNSGEIILTFNDEWARLFPGLYDVKAGALLNIEQICSFTNSMSFRLYEIIRSGIHSACVSNVYFRGVASKEDGGYSEDDIGGGNLEAEKFVRGVFKLVFDVNELKFELGCVDTSNEKIKDVFQEGKMKGKYAEIMEKICKMAEEEKDEHVREMMTPKWGDWRNFRHTLENAVDQINDLTELDISIDYHRSGRGGKVYQILFLVHSYETVADKIRAMNGFEDDWKEVSTETGKIIEKSRSKEEKKAIYIADKHVVRDRCAEAFDVAANWFSEEQIEELLRLCDMDIEKFKTYFEYTKGRGKRVIYFFEYMKDAIKKGYLDKKDGGSEEEPNHYYSARKPRNLDNYTTRSDEEWKPVLENYDEDI